MVDSRLLTNTVVPGVSPLLLPLPIALPNHPLGFPLMSSALSRVNDFYDVPITREPHESATPVLVASASGSSSGIATNSHAAASIASLDPATALRPSADNAARNGSGSGGRNRTRKRGDPTTPYSVADANFHVARLLKQGLFPEEVRHPQLRVLYDARLRAQAAASPLPLFTTTRTRDLREALVLARAMFRPSPKTWWVVDDDLFPLKWAWRQLSDIEQQTAFLHLCLRHGLLNASCRTASLSIVEDIYQDRLLVFPPALMEVSNPVSFDEGRSNRVAAAIRERMEHVANLTRPDQASVRFALCVVDRDSSDHPRPVQHRQQRRAESLILAQRFMNAFQNVLWAPPVTASRHDRRGSDYVPTNQGLDQGDFDLFHGLSGLRQQFPADHIHVIMIWRGPDGFAAGPQYDLWSKFWVDPAGPFHYGKSALTTLQNTEAQHNL